MMNTFTKIKDKGLFKIYSLIPRDPKVLILLMLALNLTTIYQNNATMGRVEAITKLYVSCSSAVLTSALPSTDCKDLLDYAAKYPKELPLGISLTDIYNLDKNIRDVDSTFPDISSITSGNILKLSSGKYYAKNLYGW